MAVIGFNQTSYTLGEGDGTVEVCAAFLQPTNLSQIAPNIVVELMGSTSRGTANGKWNQLYQQLNCIVPTNIHCTQLASYPGSAAA